MPEIKRGDKVTLRCPVEVEIIGSHTIRCLYDRNGQPRRMEIPVEMAQLVSLLTPVSIPPANQTDNITTPTGPGVVITCPVCGKELKNRFALAAHAKLHRNNKKKKGKEKG